MAYFFLIQNLLQLTLFRGSLHYSSYSSIENIYFNINLILWSRGKRLLNINLIFFHFVIVNLAFRLLRSHLMLKLIFLFSENWIFFIYKKKTWSRHFFFCFIFLKENKIINKIINVTPYLEKTIYGKPKLGSMVRLLIGKVWWCVVTPL